MASKEDLSLWMGDLQADMESQPDSTSSYYIEEYIKRTFDEQGLKTPDYVFGSVIYWLLKDTNDQHKILEAYKVICKVLKILIFRQLNKRNPLFIQKNQNNGQPDHGETDKRERSNNSL